MSKIWFRRLYNWIIFFWQLKHNWGKTGFTQCICAYLCACKHMPIQSTNMCRVTGIHGGNIVCVCVCAWYIIILRQRMELFLSNMNMYTFVYHWIPDVMYWSYACNDKLSWRQVSVWMSNGISAVSDCHMIAIILQMEMRLIHAVRMMDAACKT